MDLDLRQVGDELYALPPQAFTAARDAHVAEAKRAGDKARASALGALKRPSVAAWLVNLLALRRADALDGLLELGDEMRAATGATQLRDLSARRRREIDAILAVVRALATDAGAPPTTQHLVEVEATLAAAMADPDAAALVRSARVVKPLAPSGFGGPGSSGSGPGGLGPGGSGPGGLGSGGSGPGGTPAAPREAAPAPSARAEAEEGAARAAAIAAAEERLDEARDALAGAIAAERDVNTEADRLSTRIAELKERLDAVHRDARAARQTRLAAERDLASAERRLTRATS